MICHRSKYNRRPYFQHSHSILFNSVHRFSFLRIHGEWQHNDSFCTIPHFYSDRLFFQMKYETLFLINVATAKVPTRPLEQMLKCCQQIHLRIKMNVEPAKTFTFNFELPGSSCAIWIRITISSQTFPNKNLITECFNFLR